MTIEIFMFEKEFLAKEKISYSPFGLKMTLVRTCYPQGIKR